MTMPYERKNAVARTEDFLVRLCDPKQTPRVPASIRKEARGLLKHYPTSYYMERAAEQAPDVFGPSEHYLNKIINDGIKHSFSMEE